jgi:hypothetical protein
MRRSHGLYARTAVMSQRNSYWDAACGTGRSVAAISQGTGGETKSADDTGYDAEGHEA